VARREAGVVVAAVVIAIVMDFLIILLGDTGSRFRHNEKRPRHFGCPNSDSVCPNSDKIYYSSLCFFLLFNANRDSSLPSGSWIALIALFWLPAVTLS
jgi:hypothetical protein